MKMHVQVTLLDRPLPPGEGGGEGGVRGCVTPGQRSIIARARKLTLRDCVAKGSPRSSWSKTVSLGGCEAVSQSLEVVLAHEGLEHLIPGQEAEALAHPCAAPQALQASLRRHRPGRQFVNAEEVAELGMLAIEDGS